MLSRFAAAVALVLASSAAWAKVCPPDSVAAGTVCLDRYEASVWRIPNATTINAALVAKIQLGSATAADLAAGGATQVGTVSDDYAPCAHNGDHCANEIFAASLASVTPASSITWFQAQEACANSGKRLPTSAEWQVGANGTPDAGPDNGTTDCNTASDSLPITGARASCVSARGAFDMVGGVAEWVTDWIAAPTACTRWGSFSDDDMCLLGASETTPAPAAFVRGGAFAGLGGTKAGPLAVHPFQPTRSNATFIGFRCAR
jgi:formylglycine-generating enzyme required for sulfatase activity